MNIPWSLSSAHPICISNSARPKSRFSLDLPLPQREHSPTTSPPKSASQAQSRSPSPLRSWPPAGSDRGARSLSLSPTARVLCLDASRLDDFIGPLPRISDLAPRFLQACPLHTTGGGSSVVITWPQIFAKTTYVNYCLEY